MRLPEILLGGLRKALEQQRTGTVFPGDVHDLLMREDGVAAAGLR
jgi:hypothetical protein